MRVQKSGKLGDGPQLKRQAAVYGFGADQGSHLRLGPVGGHERLQMVVSSLRLSARRY